MIAIMISALGGAVSTILGWLGSNDPFMPRKFLHGLVRATIGGAFLAVGLNVTGSSKEYVFVFFSAMGFDAGINNLVKGLGVAEKLKAK